MRWLPRGRSGLQIARELGLHRHTVERNLRLPQCPEWARHPRTPNMLDPFEQYLRTRWAEGGHNALGLWREIVAQGFPGTSRTVSRFVTYLRQQEQNSQEEAPHGRSAPADRTQRRGLTVREAAGLLVRPLDTLTPDQQFTRTSICQAHAEIARTDALLNDFRQVFRDRDPQALTAWLIQAEQSGVPELRAFVVKLRQDLPAIQAAVVSPYSQRPVEGNIHRLKLLKRSMYGRGNFDLLKQRVLYSAALSA
jgi:transposase